VAATGQRAVGLADLGAVVEEPQIIVDGFVYGGLLGPGWRRAGIGSG
jgi:hypothetical protein